MPRLEVEGISVANVSQVHVSFRISEKKNCVWSKECNSLSPQRDIYLEAGAAPVQMLSTEPVQSSPAHVPHPAGAEGE